MSLTGTNVKTYYPGPGGTVFPTTFKVFASSEVVVQKLDQTTDEVVATLELDTDYTIAGVGNPAATITLNDDLGDYALLLRRVTVPTQTKRLPDTGAFYPSTVENALDLATASLQEHDEQLNRSIKLKILAPLGGVEIEPTPGYALGFDAGGNVVPVANTGADQTLEWTAADNAIRSDLASSVAGKGASLVGLESGRTVQAKVSDLVSAEDHGAVGDGVTDDTAAIAAALTAAVHVSLVAGKTYLTTGLTPPTGSSLVCIGGRATLKLGGGGTTLLTVDVAGFTLDGINLLGPSVASYASHLSSIGTKSGLSFNNAAVQNCSIKNCDVSGFDKYGIYVGTTSSASGYFKSVVFQNVNCYKNYQNWFLDSSGEYCDLLGCHGHDGFIGIQVTGGNNKAVGCNFDRNYRNCYLVNGTNSHHGGFYGCSFNHAQDNGYGLHATGVVYGEMFVGCAFWYGDIYMNGCNGITITQGQLANITVSVVGGNLNWIKDNWTYGTITRAFSGFWQTIWRNNRSAYQDSAQDNQWPDLYVEANLSSGANWASTGGAQFTGFNTVVFALRHSVSDPTNTYASAAGICGLSGHYDWDINLGMSAHAGAAAQLVTLTLNIYSDGTYTTINQSHRVTYELPAGATLRSLPLKCTKWCRYGQTWKLYIKTSDANGIDVVVADSKLYLRAWAP